MGQAENGDDQAPSGKPASRRFTNDWSQFNRWCAFVFAAWLYSLTLPGGLGVLAGLLALLTLVCFAQWVLYLLRVPRPVPVKSIALLPVLVLALYVLAVGNIPMRVQFFLAQPSFDQVADGVVADLESSPGRDVSVDVPALIGGYPIREAVAIEDAVFLFDSFPGLIAETGFARLPEGGPGRAELYDYSFTHLSGDWYTFVYDPF